MSKAIDEHLKKMNTTGIKWDDLTQQQRLELQKTWDAILADPANLSCSCPRKGCPNNRNCKNCVALHRYYDGFPDCLRPIDDALQAELPVEKRYNMHAKIRGEGGDPATGQPFKAEDLTDEAWLKIMVDRQMDPHVAMKRWAAIVADPKNTICDCPKTDCSYHGNCVKCVALHKYYEGFPHCVRYIVDEIETVVEAYKQAANN